MWRRIQTRIRTTRTGTSCLSTLSFLTAGEICCYFSHPSVHHQRQSGRLGFPGERDNTVSPISFVFLQNKRFKARQGLWLGSTESPIPPTQPPPQSPPGGGEGEGIQSIITAHTFTTKMILHGDGQARCLSFCLFIFSLFIFLCLFFFFFRWLWVQSHSALSRNRNFEQNSEQAEAKISKLLHVD